MLSPISDTLYTLVYLILKPSFQAGICVVAILLMRKTRAKGTVGLTQEASSVGATTQTYLSLTPAAMGYIFCLACLGTSRCRTKQHMTKKSQMKAHYVHLFKISKAHLFSSSRGRVKLRQELLEFSKASCLILSLVNLRHWASAAADCLHSWRHKGRLNCQGH